MNRWKSSSSAEKLLVCLFLVSLPFVYPRVRVDGVGYYAYARSILIDHNLRFAGDWAPDHLFLKKIYKDGQLISTQPGGLYPVETIRDGHIVQSGTTKTGHLP